MKKRILPLLLSLILLVSILAGCSRPADEGSKAPDGENNAEMNSPQEGENNADNTQPPEGTDGGGENQSPEENYDGKLVFDHSMELSYAKCFTIDYYKGGYKLATISDGTKLLTVPEGMSVPADVPEGTIVLQEPLGHILVSSAPVVSLISAVGALDAVSLTTNDVDTWYIDEVKDAINSGSLTYVGEYDAPDYEKITADGTRLAVYSAMLTEDVEAELKSLGVGVMVDRSSDEDHPLGRAEWIKFYGALLGREEAAQEVFSGQEAIINELSEVPSTGKSVAVFYITSSGSLYARKAGDYMAKMVELAGGVYVPGDVGVGESGTSKMEYEAFYDAAKDADYIIYVWSMGGKPETLEDFLGRADILSEFKAVKEGNVWCTTPDFFQIQATIGSMVNDIRLMLEADGTVDALTYLTKLK